MGRHKDFDAARAEHAGEPLTFTLGGREWHCVTDLPITPVLDVADVLDLDEMDPAAMRAITSLLTCVVVPDEREAFTETLRTEGVGIRTLMEVISWAMEELSGRPLPSASPSPLVESPGGEPSRVVSLSQAPETRSA